MKPTSVLLIKQLIDLFLWDYHHIADDLSLTEIAVGGI